jgi:predicted phosphodiesterase
VKKPEKKKDTLIVFSGDWHCGARTGLAPPDWEWQENNGVRGPWAKAQGKVWDWFEGEIKSLGTIDYLVTTGDIVEGGGEKNCGAELSIPNLDEQAECAADVIRFIKPKVCRIIRGTRYHTGKVRILEDTVAQLVGAPQPTWREKFSIGGKVFNVRHKMSKSNLPHTRFTPLARAAMWDLWESARCDDEAADVIIRGHTHQFLYLGYDGVLAINCPSLQLPRTDFGEADCEGELSMGFLSFKIGEGGMAWHAHLLPVESYHRGVLRL